MDMTDWSNDEYGVIETPFDIEAILRADSKLYEEWRRRPFYLDKDKDGDVFVNYQLPNGFPAIETNSDK